jgi:hypothetical protein
MAVTLMQRENHLSDTTRLDRHSTLPDDAIRPLTRGVAAAVIPFLLAAFIILYLFPGSTGRLFAWEIASPLTAALMGAGYLGGAYFFGRVLAGRRWHEVAAGFPPVAVFTVIMLAVTLLHWANFNTGNWPFWVWLGLYLLTPILVTLAWWSNRPADPRRSEPGDALLPPAAGIVATAAGLALLAAAIGLFVMPERAAELWPWPLTPLTARVVAGWLALLGVGALALRGERRWSAWRVPLQSVLLWQALLAVAFVWRREAFGPGGPLNWFTLFTIGGLIVAAGFYLVMERRRRLRDT